MARHPPLAPAPDTGRVHVIVKTENRILNPKAIWLQYNADYTKFDNPEPSDTFDGADVDPNNSLNNVSWGVVDDTCDAVIEATLVVAGVRHSPAARVFAGPPDFAPDRRPFVALVDELADRKLGDPARSDRGGRRAGRGRDCRFIPARQRDREPGQPGRAARQRHRR